MPINEGQDATAAVDELQGGVEVLVAGTPPVHQRMPSHRLAMTGSCLGRVQLLLLCLVQLLLLCRSNLPLLLRGHSKFWWLLCCLVLLPCRLQSCCAAVRQYTHGPNGAPGTNTYHEFTLGQVVALNEDGGESGEIGDS